MTIFPLENTSGFAACCVCTDIVACDICWIQLLIRYFSIIILFFSNAHEGPTDDWKTKGTKKKTNKQTDKQTLLCDILGSVDCVDKH